MTTTPKNVRAPKAVMKNPSTVVSHAPTEANKAFLAMSFLEEVRARYDGTSLGRQELDGALLEDAEGAVDARHDRGGAGAAARQVQPRGGRGRSGGVRQGGIGSMRDHCGRCGDGGAATGLAGLVLEDATVFSRADGMGEGCGQGLSSAWGWTG